GAGLLPVGGALEAGAPGGLAGGDALALTGRVASAPGGGSAAVRSGRAPAAARLRHAPSGRASVASARVRAPAAARLRHAPSGRASVASARVRAPAILAPREPLTTCRSSSIIKLALGRGAVAQLGERVNGIHEVGG